MGLNPLAADAIPAQAAGSGSVSRATPRPSPPRFTHEETGSTDPLQLSPEAERQVQKLKARDAEVRAHEAAHMSAGGGLVRGGATYTYQRGPDGRQYAVGGEVSIDTGSVPGDPRATLAKAQRIRAAALAPANPSAQDHAVAAAADQMASEAASELARGKAQPGRFFDQKA